jgi:hypothetical protein
MKNRWWIYQQERFPIFMNAPLVIVFCLSVLLFSAMQQVETYAPSFMLVSGAAISTLILFFQLRVADEFKDYETDSEYRPHRAVPRGLVKLRELAVLAYVGAAIQFGIALYFDVGLVAILAGVWLYIALMTKEFFVPAWLREHPVAYLLSHMLIMPIIAFYISAFDWLCICNSIPTGLGWLLLLSFCCGLVLEVGRKTKSPAKEREGVETYSALWGAPVSVAIWIGCIALSAAAYLNALSFVTPVNSYPIFALSLPIIGFAAAIPLLKRKWSLQNSADVAIEPTSGLVALTLYLCLGPIQFFLGW